MEVILASQSPRRQELMGLFPFSVSISVPHIDETMERTEDPARAVMRVSRNKALAVSPAEDRLVIAADTIVVCDGQILGKPASEEDAFRMLQLLSGRVHQVMTGVTVLCGSQIRSFTEITDVIFRPLTPEEIRAYIRTGEPMDKAGAYGIQGKAGLFVEKICGDYYNVVGLPVCKLACVLQEIAPSLMEETQ